MARSRSTLGDVQEISPSKVFFTHQNISNKFRSGLYLDEAVDLIVDGVMEFSAFPPLICVVKDGTFYSLNNRRLKSAPAQCAQQRRLRP